MSTSMSGSSSTSQQPPGLNRERCQEGSMDGTSGGLPAEPAPLSQHGGMGMPPQAGSSNSEEASSEEMIPDHLLPRRVPPAPPLPRRLRSVQISTSGASSSAAPPRRVRGRSARSCARMTRPVPANRPALSREPQTEGESYSTWMLSEQSSCGH